MKSFILAVLFVGITTVLFAAEKEGKATSGIDKISLTMINGQVVDKLSNEALVGVKIVLEDTKQTTYTDFDGNYSFKNIEKGLHKLTASYISYDKLSLETIKTSNKSNHVDFSLKITN